MPTSGGGGGVGGCCNESKRPTLCRRCGVDGVCDGNDGVGSFRIVLLLLKREMKQENTCKR